LTNNSELPVGVYAANPWVQASVVVVLVDTYATLWCIELATEDVWHQLSNIVAMSLPHCIGKYMHLKI
jgi:hypothetical protein